MTESRSSSQPGPKGEPRDDSTKQDSTHQDSPQHLRLTICLDCRKVDEEYSYHAGHEDCPREFPRVAEIDVKTLPVTDVTDSR
jgi:hypothetical protein